jgi:hypothetical protein
VSRDVILVLSDDPLSAALLGAAAELAGYTPRFPLPDEPVRTALRRVRPRLVLVDCDHAEACAEEFVGPAIMTGTRMLLFRSRRTRSDPGEFAERLGLRVLDLPVDHEGLCRVLRETFD